MEEKTKEWLKRESEKWVEDGIITPQQCSQIQMRYSEIKTSSPLLMLFSIIGSLLVGAGILLVFATNWWNLAIEIKIVLAFLPLLLAQGICLYTLKRKYDSASFREGGTVFLSLSFFAVLALIGQIFHTPGNFESYLLVCILFTLPGVYIFRSRAAMTIYAAGSLFVTGYCPAWGILALSALGLPFFYLELVHVKNRRGVNYLLFLLSLMGGNMIGAARGLEFTEVLLIDALFRKISSVYFFTVLKLFSILTITAVMLFYAFDISGSISVSTVGIVLSVLLAAAYFLLRRSDSFKLSSADLFLAADIILMLSGNAAGFAACLLAMGLGIYFIVLGSKTLVISKLNYGMTLVILIILIRYFDSSFGLLGRGILFILLGCIFLGVNVYISHKRKGMKK